MSDEARLKNKRNAEKSQIKELMYGEKHHKIDFKSRQISYIKELEKSKKQIEPKLIPKPNPFPNVKSKLLEPRIVVKPKEIIFEGLKPIHPFGSILQTSKAPVKNKRPITKSESTEALDLEEQETLIIKELGKCKNAERKIELINRLKEVHSELEMLRRPKWK